MRSYQFNGQEFVRLRDQEGNRVACPIHKVKNPNEISNDELPLCVADATAANQSR